MLENLGSNLGSFAGIAILGTIMGMVVKGWASVKSFFTSSFKILIVSAHIKDDETARAVKCYMINTFKASNSVEKTFGGKHDHLKDGKYGLIPYELFEGTKLFWNGWIPIIFKMSVTKPQTVTYYDQPQTSFSIMSIRYTVNAEEIIKKASEHRNQIYWDNGVDTTHKRFFIQRIPDPAAEEGKEKYAAKTSLAWFQEGDYRLLSHSANDIGRATTHKKGRALDHLYFPPSVNKLVQEIEMWRKLRGWYMDRGIPWKRGLVLHGPPGTGKSAIARAIAEDFDLPMFSYSLGRMMNSELEKSWMAMQSHIPCIALLEDFDCVFHGRENVYGKTTLSSLMMTLSKDTKQEQKDVEAQNRGLLSFDCLLNCLDGVDKGGGIFTIITTNHIDKLDPALGRPTINKDGTTEFISTRPGRIDNAVELGYMQDTDKLKLARRIFSDDEIGYHKMKMLVEREPNKQETPAQFQERCTQLALQTRWQQENELVEVKINRGNLPKPNGVH